MLINKKPINTFCESYTIFLSDAVYRRRSHGLACRSNADGANPDANTDSNANGGNASGFNKGSADDVEYEVQDEK